MNYVPTQKPRSRRRGRGMREKLIAAGVRNLKEFGYPAVNEKNILTDMIYSEFFRQMLEEVPAGPAKYMAKLLLLELPKERP